LEQGKEELSIFCHAQERIKLVKGIVRLSGLYLFDVVFLYLFDPPQIKKSNNFI
jgi:hypothetical protein